MAADGGQSPLEQFVIKPIVPAEIGGVDVSFTNSALFMTIAVVVAEFFLVLGMRRSDIVPGAGRQRLSCPTTSLQVC